MAGELLLCSCFVKRDEEGVGLRLVQHMKCVPSLDAADEALKCSPLLWALTHDGDDVSKGGRSVKENDCTMTKKYL